MSDNREIAQNVLQAVGGKENITSVVHCMTRLRFVLKDSTIPDTEKVKQIDGVLSVVERGGQYQVVIGQNVDKVYAELCDIAGLEEKKEVPAEEDREATETAPKGKKKFSFKKFGAGILDGIAGCMTPLIPLLCVAGLLKMIPVLLGPNMIGAWAEDSDIYRLFTFLGDTGFYFLPVFLGYTGAKKFGATPILGMLLGAMLIHPSFLEIVNAGEPFTVYGIPCTLENYSSTVVPMILATWCMGYVERFFKKRIPDYLSTVFTPFLTILIMIPLTFCFFGPVGYWLGNGVGFVLDGIHSVAGPVGFALVAGLWSLLLMTGMHLVLLVPSFVRLAESGYDNFVLAASAITGFATYGVLLGGFIRAKKKETKAEIGTYFLSSFLGGVGEPALYGFMLKYKKPMLAQIIGGFCGGLVGGICGIACYQLVPVMNFLNFLCFAGGSARNIVCAAISCAVAVVVGCVMTIILGFDEEKA